MRHFDFSPRHPSPATSVTWACLAFLAWLVSALRPTTLVSLGSRSTPYPVSLCSYVPTSTTNNQGILTLFPLHWLAPAQILIGRVTIICLPRRHTRYAAGPQNALKPIPLLSCSLLTLDQKVHVHGASARKVPRRASRGQRGFHYPKIGTYYSCTTAKRPWGCSQRINYIIFLLVSTPSHRLVYNFYFVVHIECKRNKAELVEEHTFWKVRRVLMLR